MRKRKNKKILKIVLKKKIKIKLTFHSCPAS